MEMPFSAITNWCDSHERGDRSPHHERTREHLLSILQKQIAGPGKFEGESPLSYYLYHCALLGDGDAGPDGSTLFTLTQGEKAFFATIISDYSLHESSDGFITLSTIF